jgi:hypothetical protein
MSLEVSGLIFLGIVVGCLLGVVTVLLCNVFLYLPQAAKYPGKQIPPEHRLYPALIGSVGLPIGLFWFGWTARADISWASPAAALMIFAWGNLCVFVSTTMYFVDTYHGLTVASAMSANSLARYVLAAAFPLFTIQSEYPLYILSKLRFNTLRSVYKTGHGVGFKFTWIYRRCVAAGTLGFLQDW